MKLRIGVLASKRKLSEQKWDGAQTGFPRNPVIVTSGPSFGMPGKFIAALSYRIEQKEEQERKKGYPCKIKISSINTSIKSTKRNKEEVLNIMKTSAATTMH